MRDSKVEHFRRQMFIKSNQILRIKLWNETRGLCQKYTDLEVMDRKINIWNDFEKSRPSRKYRKNNIWQIFFRRQRRQPSRPTCKACQSGTLTLERPTHRDISGMWILVSQFKKSRWFWRWWCWWWKYCCCCGDDVCGGIKDAIDHWHLLGWPDLSKVFYIWRRLEPFSMKPLQCSGHCRSN